MHTYQDIGAEYIMAVLPAYDDASWITPAHRAVIADYMAGRDVRTTPIPAHEQAEVAAAHAAAHAAGTSLASPRQEYESQPCPLCAATGTAPRVAALGAYAGGRCEACLATGRIPTQRFIRQAADNSSRAAVRSKRRGLYLGRQVELAHKALAAGHTVSLELYRASSPLSAAQATTEEVTEPAAVQQALTHMQAEVLRYAGIYHEAQRTYEGALSMVVALRQVRSCMQAVLRATAPAAAVATGTAVAAKPQRCRTPKCRKEPTVWDAQGRGWCRPHAYRRGLLQREAAPGDA